MAFQPCHSILPWKTRWLRLLVVLGVACTSMQAMAQAALLNVPPQGGRTKDAASPAHQMVQALIVDVEINGQAWPQSLTVLKAPNGGWALDRSTWEMLRLQAPRQWQQHGLAEDHAWLNDLPGARLQFDEQLQLLQIELAPAAFETFRVGVDGSGAERAMAGVTPGAYANYDLRVQHADSDWRLAGQVEATAFWANGRLTSSSFVRRQPGERVELTRLETTLGWDDPGGMRALRLGDFVSRSGLWGRPARLGGVQWGTDFSIRPEYVSHAVPLVRGEAYLPSTVEVMLGQNRVASTQVPAGPFEWTQLPMVTGSGDLRLVITDVLGRTHEVVQPYLISERLLRPGLSEFAVEAGRIREDYGIRSNAYGRTAALAQWRHGWHERFTGEWRAEWADGQAAVGLGGIWQSSSWLQLEAAVAGSASREGLAGDGLARKGHLWQWAAELRQPAWSARVRSSRQSEGFVQLGSILGEGRPRGTDQLTVLLPWSKGGLGLTWGRQRLQQLEDHRFWMINLSAQLSSQVFLSAYVQRSDDDRQRPTVGVMILMPIGDNGLDWRVHASRQDKSRTMGVEVGKPVGPGTGWGYRVLAEDRDGAHVQARVERRTAQADWEAEVFAREGTSALSAGVSGSLVAMDGQWMAGRPVQGSFALVKVGAEEGVPVYRDHHLVGHTDANGRLLVTDLRPYQSNRIEVDPNDLPMEVSYDALVLKLSPALQGGVVADLGVRRQHPLTLTLLAPDGQALPPGVSVRAVLEAGDDEERRVGFEGRLFEPDASAVERYELNMGGFHCVFALPANLRRTTPELNQPVALVCEKEVRS